MIMLLFSCENDEKADKIHSFAKDRFCAKSSTYQVSQSLVFVSISGASCLEKKETKFEELSILTFNEHPACDRLLVLVKPYLGTKQFARFYLGNDYVDFYQYDPKIDYRYIKNIDDIKSDYLVKP